MLSMRAGAAAVLVALLGLSAAAGAQTEPAGSAAALGQWRVSAGEVGLIVLGVLLAICLIALAWALYSRNRHRRLSAYYEKCFYETRDSLDLVATALGQRRFISIMRLGCERAAATNPQDT